MQLCEYHMQKGLAISMQPLLPICFVGRKISNGQIGCLRARSVPSRVFVPMRVRRKTVAEQNATTTSCTHGRALSPKTQVIEHCPHVKCFTAVGMVVIKRANQAAAHTEREGTGMAA